MTECAGCVLGPLIGPFRSRLTATWRVCRVAAHGWSALCSNSRTPTCRSRRADSPHAPRTTAIPPTQYPRPLDVSDGSTCCTRASTEQVEAACLARPALVGTRARPESDRARSGDAGRFRASTHDHGRRPGRLQPNESGPSDVERATGIEPAQSVWKTETLPLSYARGPAPGSPPQVQHPGYRLAVTRPETARTLVPRQRPGCGAAW